MEILKLNGKMKEIKTMPLRAQQKVTRFTIEVEIDEIWIDDGFTMSEASLNKMRNVILPYASDREKTFQVIKVERNVTKE